MVKLPVVGKRCKVYLVRGTKFVGRCVSAKGEFWEFKLETFVLGDSRDWGIGDVMAVRAAFIAGIEEIPLDAKGGS